MTSEEIVRALRCCEYGECGRCPLYSDKQRCQEHLLYDAADLIERLEKEKAALLKFAMESAGYDQCKHYGTSCGDVYCLCCEKECACASCIKGSR